MKRSVAETWTAFEIQKQAIEISSLAFDGGCLGEAVRLANSIFIVLGRGMRRHKSILDQLGLQDVLKFPTTVSNDSKSSTPLIEALLMIWQGELLVELRPRGFGALMTGRHLSFEQWWNEVVLRDASAGELTRRAVIRSMRDQDGGAHFDETIADPAYLAAVQGRLAGFLMKDETGESQAVPFALENTMRQIAEEVRLLLRPIRRHT